MKTLNMKYNRNFALAELGKRKYKKENKNVSLPFLAGRFMRFHSLPHDHLCRSEEEEGDDVLHEQHPYLAARAIGR